ARAAEHEHARSEPDGCEQPDDCEDLDLWTDGEVHVSPRVSRRQLTVQVPGVNSVPTEIPPPGPCCTAIQRPATAVRQKSVGDAAKPAGLMTNGAPGTVERDASYFVASVGRSMAV